MDLTIPQIALLRSLLRMEKRRTERKQIAAQRKWGDDYDPSALDARAELIDETLEALR